MSKGINKVIVVGAGPVGLLAALSIAQLGINVDVLESSHEIDGRPRGAAYGPSGVR
jgi:2-polyprenyl-6-methoxyphenol hydroxylase-like FAD-dependent oxidoreductase